MKTMLRTAFAAIALVATTAAFADDRHGHDRGRYDHDYRHDNGRWRHDNGWHGHRPPPPPPHYGHGYYHRPPPAYYGPPPRYYQRWGHWERGHRYYGRPVVVYDYGSYRLRPPPRGYHWVRDNSDFLLVAIATGVILDIATR